VIVAVAGVVCKTKDKRQRQEIGMGWRGIDRPICIQDEKGKERKERRKRYESKQERKEEGRKEGREREGVSYEQMRCVALG
jgi:hypothetical protein